MSDPGCPSGCTSDSSTWGKNLGCESASPTKHWCYDATCYSKYGLCNVFKKMIEDELADSGASAAASLQLELVKAVADFDCGTIQFKNACTDLGVEDSGAEISDFEGASIEDIIEAMEDYWAAIEAADTDLYSTAYDALANIEEIGEEGDHTYYLKAFPGVDSDSTSTINEFGLFFDPTEGKPILNSECTDDNNCAETSDSLSENAMSIMADSFYDAYGIKQILYSNIRNGISNPSTDGWVATEDTNYSGDFYLTWEYDAAELGLADFADQPSTALFKKFNYTMGNTEEDLLEVIEELISAGVADMTTTLGTPQYTFKKIKHLALDTDNLSSFDEEEVKQTVATGLSTIEESSEESSY